MFFLLYQAASHKTVHRFYQRSSCKIEDELVMTKEARIYNGEKTVSSVSGAGKTGQLHVKE